MRPEKLASKFRFQWKKSYLDAELLEKRSGDDSFAGRECVWVKQSAADDADEDDAKPATIDG